MQNVFFEMFTWPRSAYLLSPLSLSLSLSLSFSVCLSLFINTPTYTQTHTQTHTLSLAYIYIYIYCVCVRVRESVLSVFAYVCRRMWMFLKYFQKKKKKKENDDKKYCHYFQGQKNTRVLGNNRVDIRWKPENNMGTYIWRLCKIKCGRLFYPW